MLSEKYIRSLCKEMKKGAPIQIATSYLGVSPARLKQYLETGELLVDCGKDDTQLTYYQELCVKLYKASQQSLWNFVSPSINHIRDSEDIKAHMWIAEKYMPKVFGKQALDAPEAPQATPPLIINKQPQGAGNNESRDDQSSNV